jgi:hypothetical protein
MHFDGKGYFVLFSIVSENVKPGRQFDLDEKRGRNLSI